MLVRTSPDTRQKTVVFEMTEDQWDLSDVHTLLDQIHELALSVPHCINVIVDMKGARALPTNWLAVVEGSERLTPRNLGVIIIASAPPIAKGLINVVRNIAPGLIDRTAFVNSVEDAHKILATGFTGLSTST
jgi:hypothetical protein